MTVTNKKHVLCQCCVLLISKLVRRTCKSAEVLYRIMIVYKFVNSTVRCCTQSFHLATWGQENTNM